MNIVTFMLFDENNYCRDIDDIIEILLEFVNNYLHHLIQKELKFTFVDQYILIML